MRFWRRRSPILRLPWTVDLTKLGGALERARVPERIEHGGSVSLMHRQGAADPWTDGQTNRVMENGESLYFSEANFTRFNPGLEGGYFEEFHEVLKKACQKRLGRVRIFRRLPLTSSSLHADLDVRLHVALETSDRALLVFPEYGIFRIPRDGHVYMVDTTRPHFAVNAHPDLTRTHIVSSTYCGFPETRAREKEIVGSARALFGELARMRNSSGLAPVSR